MARKVIRKWGNSLGLRLPKEVAQGAQLHEGSAVEVAVEQGRVVLIPARQRYSLDKLLAEVRPDNLHDEVDAETPHGKEAL